MLLHYLKIAWRNILKDKGYAIINIIGLSIAMSCCFLLIFWVKFELSYENCYPRSGSIYRIITEEQRTDGLAYNLHIRPGITKQLKSSFPQIEYATFIRHESLPFVIEGTEMEGIMATYVPSNEDYLRIFAYEYLEGSPRSVVDSRGCVMSEEAARKFFGNESAIGKTVAFSKTLSCNIVAVVKVPENTHINFDILDPAGNTGSFGGTHYIKLKEGYKMTPEFEEQIARFLSTMSETDKRLKLQPIRKMHLHSPKEITNSTYGSISQIVLFSGAALLILLAAMINYVNTSIARTINRMKEVGVRKVFGSNRKQLIFRFLIESFILSFLAVIVSLGLAELLFPAFSEIMGNRITLDFSFMAILIALLACIVVTILSGGYAAFYLSSFRPMLIIRRMSKPGTKERLRKGLVGVQFFLSISVFICTVFIYKQINAIFNAETGVTRENILILDSSLWYGVEDFIQTIKKENPNIIDASIALSAPYNSSYNYSGVRWTGSEDDAKEMAFTQIFCDHNYANTFGLQLVQGEFIPPGLKWWQYADEKSFDIVINESFKKLIGEENPLGITVSYGWGFRGKIIGVVKDFNFKPLREPISPLIISFNPESCTKLFIRTTGNDQKATYDYIFAKYREMKFQKDRPLMYHTVEDEYKEMYETELRTAGVLSTFSIISLLLALMGIVSMISFMIEKRSKEIAIRRINGAKIWHISELFSKDLLMTTVITSAISIPLCYFIMSKWLQDYIYRTTLSWWIFFLVPVLIMIVTLCVITIQIYISAQKNPTESLKSE